MAEVKVDSKDLQDIKKILMDIYNTLQSIKIELSKTRKENR